MRILFLSENFPPETNAAATRVYERAIHWVRDGHKVTILTSAPNFPYGLIYEGYKNRWRQVEEMDGIRVVRVKTFMARNEGVVLRTLDFLSFMVSAVIVGLFEKKPDVVCSTSPQFFSALGGWILSKIKKKPFVFELGDLWPASIVAVGAMQKSIFLRCVEKLELFLYQQSTFIAALTFSFKKNLINRGIDKNKIRVVRNGVDLERYKKTKRNKKLALEYKLQDHFVVGYVGTHGMAHALEYVIDAASLLGAYPKIRILFAGAGATRNQIIAKAQKAELTNTIFLPMQPKEKICEIWSLCDVALVHLKNKPAFSEVIPSKIFEAMAVGLPILISAPPGEATEIIDSERVGISVPPENPASLANAIVELYEQPQKRNTLSKNATLAAPNYSRKTQAAEMIDVFAAAIDGGSVERELQS